MLQMFLMLDPDHVVCACACVGVNDEYRVRLGLAWRIGLLADLSPHSMRRGGRGDACGRLCICSYGKAGPKSESGKLRYF